MPRKVDPSELSAVSRQILSRMSDPPVDLNDLWVVPAAECEGLLREAYGKYGLEAVSSAPRTLRRDAPASVSQRVSIPANMAF